MIIDIQLTNLLVDVVLASITFCAVIVALFGKTFWEWYNRPKIKFYLKNDRPYIINKYCRGGQSIKYFRIKIKNEGNTKAINCYVKILSVTTKKNSMNLIEPDKLKWSSAPLDLRYNLPREKIDIFPSGGWEFCDLFKLDSYNLTDIFFQSLGKDRYVPIKEDYIITLEISGENIKPLKAKLVTSLPKKGFSDISINWLR